MLNRPIRSLPSRDASGNVVQVAISIVPMTRRLVSQWASVVQPLVDVNYQHHAPGLPPRAVRADVGWNWRSIYALASAQSWFLSPARAICMTVQPSSAPPFPIGMLTMVPQLPTTVHGVQRDRGFGWYLSDAPYEAYQQILRTAPVKGVAAALIDCSIQATLDCGSDGTHLLHADPNGGDKLVRFYRDDCKMTQLPATHGPITPVFRRANPAEYFLFNDVEAGAYSATYDARR